MSEISSLAEVLFDDNDKPTKPGALIIIAMCVGMLCNSYRLLRGKRL